MKKTLICLLGLGLVGCGQMTDSDTPVMEEEMPAVDVEVTVPGEVMVPEVPESEVPAAE